MKMIWVSRFGLSLLSILLFLFGLTSMTDASKEVQQRRTLSILQVLEQSFPVRVRRDDETGRNNRPEAGEQPRAKPLLQPRKLEFTDDLDNIDSYTLQNLRNRVPPYMTPADHPIITYDHHENPSGVEENGTQSSSESQPELLPPTTLISGRHKEEEENLKLHQAKPDNVTPPKLKEVVEEAGSSVEIEISLKNKSVDKDISNLYKNVANESNVSSSRPFETRENIPQTKLKDIVVNETRTIEGEGSMHAEKEMFGPLQTFQGELEGLLAPFWKEATSQKQRTEITESWSDSALRDPQSNSLRPRPKSSFLSSVAMTGILFVSVLTITAVIAQLFSEFPDETRKRTESSATTLSPLANSMAWSKPLVHSFEFQKPGFFYLRRSGSMGGSEFKFGDEGTRPFSPFLSSFPHFHLKRK